MVILFSFILLLLVARNDSTNIQHKSFLVEVNQGGGDENFSSIISAAPNSTELEAFFDAAYAFQYSNYALKGLTVSAVKDNEIIFTKGYGYSNEYLSETVHPNQSMFKIGSISKTFNAIAVMQLVEDGLLNLDVDVNVYLSYFKIPSTFAEAITLRHLLTHTAGFEEAHNSTITFEITDVPTLEEFVSTSIPKRVNKPGFVSAYSNYGIALAGYIVQIVSGKNFEQYIEDEIITPLGMNFTTFKQPLPNEYLPFVATGYNEYGIAQPFEYIRPVSAGSCLSTANDMAKLMIALQNNGSYNGTQILQADSIQAMQQAQFLPHKDLPWVGFGLYQMFPNSVKVIGHGGDTVNFHSTMALFPEENLGIFFSYNSREGGIADEVMLMQFINVFYPYTKTAEPMINSDKNLKEFEGLYVSTRRHYSSYRIITSSVPEGFIDITEQDYLEEALSITADNGSLYLENLIEFVQVEPDYFVEKSGLFDYEMGFIRDSKHRIIHFYANFATSNMAYEKIHFVYGKQSDNLTIFSLITAGLSLLALLWWFIEFIIKKVKKEEIDRFIISMPKIFPVVVIASTLIIGIGVTKAVDKNLLTVNELRTSYTWLIPFAILTVLFTGLMLLFSVFSWIGIGNKEKKPYWKIWDRIFYLLISIGSIFLVVMFALWGLLG